MLFQNDTIKIKEVVISRMKLNSDPAGYKKHTIDSSILKNYNHCMLADVLSENSNIYINSYGMGGTATPSLRGTGASHTQVAWNGININQPMLGQSDLAIIPAGLIDDILIYFGGASMVLNSGGIGGIINLETLPIWKKETSISISPGLGSFGNYSGSVNVKSGNINFQTVTKAFLQYSENDFRYLNNVMSADPVRETRKNSQVNQQGFLQELYYRKENNSISARIWYQSANRNLPGSMLIEQSNSDEKQYDESLRTMLNYNVFHSNGDYSITGAWMSDRLNYSDRIASIYSRNLSNNMILKADATNNLGECTKLKIILDEELNNVKSNNYSKNATRNTCTLTASVERNASERFTTTLLLREIYYKNTFLIPDFSAGLQFRVIDQRECFLKANISRNSKIPTMNDMFWIPGGDPGLKNEYAYIYEMTYEINHKISAPFTFKYDISVFHNNIKDMIVWHPGEYSYWTPDNIQKVNTMGLESSFLLNYTVSNFTSTFHAGYSFTRAITAGSNDNTDLSIGKQLMYIPENQANASLRLSYRNLYASWVQPGWKKICNGG